MHAQRRARPRPVPPPRSAWSRARRARGAGGRRARASSGSAPAIVSSRCSAPWLPPNTTTVVRPGSRPNVAQRLGGELGASRRHVEDPRAHRVARQCRSRTGPCSRSRGALERQADRLRAPREQPVREARDGVLLVQHQRDVRPAGGEARRHAHVAADAHDDVGPREERARGRAPSAARRTEPEPRVAENSRYSGAASTADGTRTRPRARAVASGPEGEPMNSTWRVVRAAEPVGEREPGEDVTARAPAGDRRPSRRGLPRRALRASSSPCARRGRIPAGPPRCIARRSRARPIPASVTTSAVPPKETSGNGTPVIGSRPVTAPMLTIACSPIQHGRPRRAGGRTCRAPAPRSGSPRTPARRTSPGPPGRRSARAPRR